MHRTPTTTRPQPAPVGHTLEHAACLPIDELATMQRFGPVRRPRPLLDPPESWWLIAGPGPSGARAGLVGVSVRTRR